MSAHDLAAELFIANAWRVEAEQFYVGLCRRGFAHRKADAISGRSKRRRDVRRVVARQNAILRSKPQSCAALQNQIAILTQREEQGLEFSTPLAKIVAGLSQPGSLTDH
jgi:hypothetical protein